MRVLVLYDGDEDCIDPLDKARQPRKHYDEIPREADVLVIYRDVVGNPDTNEGWPRWHMTGQGVFEHVRMKDFKKVLRKLGVA